MNDKELKGSLITGASRGIGYELAKLAARDGYNPILVSRSEEDLLEVREELEKEYDVKAKVITGDLSNSETPDEIYREVEQTNYKIDLLVNNAGRGQMGEFTETDWEVDQEMMNLNMEAVVHLTKLFLPGMKDRGHGKILNVSSLGAFQPGPLMALYYATKAFVQNFSEGLAEEVEKYGITVSALSPGPVDTEFKVKGRAPTNGSEDSYAVSPEKAAEVGYRGLKNGKRVTVPGTFTSIAPQLVRFLPRKTVAKFVRKLNEYQLQ